jgi:hypothetical protein
MARIDRRLFLVLLAVGTAAVAQGGASGRAAGAALDVTYYFLPG